MHSHTSAANLTYTIGNARVVGCPQCNEDALIERLSVYVRQWDGYTTGAVNPWRLADLLERKAGPKAYQYNHASNSRSWGWLRHRLTLRVAWGLNWTLGLQLWGDRDYGFIYGDLGPLRLHLYARWGLDEDERIERWLRDPA